MHTVTFITRRAWKGALLVLVFAGAALGTTAPAAASPAPLVIALQQAQPAPTGDGFEPVSQLPAQEQLPAAPLVMVAYSVVWIMVVAFVVSLWRRMGTVERELKEVEQRVSQGARR